MSPRSFTLSDGIQQTITPIDDVFKLTFALGLR
jgi:hypothetical protein